MVEDFRPRGRRHAGSRELKFAVDKHYEKMLEKI